MIFRPRNCSQLFREDVSSPRYPANVKVQLSQLKCAGVASLYRSSDGLISMYPTAFLVNFVFYFRITLIWNDRLTYPPVVLLQSAFSLACRNDIPRSLSFFTNFENERNSRTKYYTMYCHRETRNSLAYSCFDRSYINFREWSDRASESSLR